MSAAKVKPETFASVAKGLFVTESGGITLVSVFLLLALPLLCSGQWIYGGIAVILSLVCCLIQIILMDGAVGGNLDRFEQRTNAMSTEQLSLIHI